MGIRFLEPTRQRYVARVKRRTVSEGVKEEQRRRSSLMARVRTHGTSIEVRARNFLRERGFPASRRPPELIGKPDLVFPTLHSLVFVHGCFWHGHFCRPSYVSKSNVAFWETKIASNMARDRRVVRRLRAEGWSCFIAWQCTLESDLRRIAKALQKKRTLLSRREGSASA